MPRENEPENENMEPKEHRVHPPHPEEIEKDGCICGKNCLCRHKHMGAKLVAALLIFLAGFGSAMMCKCMSHRGCPYHHMHGKQMAMNLADGAGNTIIINTDGTCTMKHHRQMPKGVKKHPQQMMPVQSMPMQNMATVTPDDEDDE